MFNPNQRKKLKSLEYETGCAKKVDFSSLVSSIKKELSSLSSEDKRNYADSIIMNGLSYWYGYSQSLDEIGIELDFYDYMRNALLDSVLEEKELDLEQLAEKEKEYIEQMQTSVEENDRKLEEIIGTLKPVRFSAEGAEAIFESIIEIVQDDTMSRHEKEKVLQILKTRNDSSAQKVKVSKEKMECFARLALSGDELPTFREITEATKILGYREEQTKEGGGR